MKAESFSILLGLLLRNKGCCIYNKLISKKRTEKYVDILEDFTISCFSSSHLNYNERFAFSLRLDMLYMLFQWLVEKLADTIPPCC